MKNKSIIIPETAIVTKFHIGGKYLKSIKINGKRKKLPTKIKAGDVFG